MVLIQLIYVSTAEIEFNSAALSDILQSCIKLNRQNKITGMLVYWRGNFMQVLEGSADAVDEAYQRICKDSRHHGLILLERNEIAEREFSAWHMGFRSLGDDEATKADGFVDFFKPGFDPRATGAKGGDALALLQMFSRV